MKKMHITVAAIALVTQFGLAKAADNYTVDPNHTYPSFEAPHIAGISMWRGKFTKTSGKVMLDRQAKSGSVDITVDATSVDSGNAKLDEHLKGDKFFEAAMYPTITFKSSKVKFSGDAPSEVDGTLTLHGVSKPVTLTVKSFKCVPHPMLKVELCGADVYTEINRADFGMKYGVEMVGSPTVKLSIQVEALKEGPKS